MRTISSPWPTTIRSHRTRTSSRAPCDAAQPPMMTAWAWWGIIPDMKSTSALLTPGGFVGAFAGWPLAADELAAGVDGLDAGAFMPPQPAAATISGAAAAIAHKMPLFMMMRMV